MEAYLVPVLRAIAIEAVVVYWIDVVSARPDLCVYWVTLLCAASASRSWGCSPNSLRPDR